MSFSHHTTKKSGAQCEMEKSENREGRVAARAPAAGTGTGRAGGRREENRKGTDREILKIFDRNKHGSGLIR